MRCEVANIVTNIMIMKKEFDDIRPYYDSEVPDAIKRIVNHPQFHIALDYLFPAEKHQEILEDVSRIRTSVDFQKMFMLPAMKAILAKTSDGLTFEGFENIENGNPGIFISNHRDILLDSALLQAVLYELRLETSEIASGSNLMVSDFVIDLSKVNRILTVVREGTPRELLANSRILSAYIRHNILDKKTSVWIAQRKGRTKDGLDKTETGILKMLTSTGPKDVIQAIRDVNIIPVCISYEWEPCDVLKIKENYYSRRDGYVKDKNEDFKSVINGIVNYKGHIHISVAKPVNSILHNIDEGMVKSAIYNYIVHYIDEQVYSLYKLWPSNYLAYDLKNNTDKYSDRYTTQTKEHFDERLQRVVSTLGKEPDELKELFIEMYANPVIQREIIENR